MGGERERKRMMMPITTGQAGKQLNKASVSVRTRTTIQIALQQIACMLAESSLAVSMEFSAVTALRTPHHTAASPSSPSRSKPPPLPSFDASSLFLPSPSVWSPRLVTSSPFETMARDSPLWCVRGGRCPKICCPKMCCYRPLCAPFSGLIPS
jgi:hypothetical protein